MDKNIKKKFSGLFPNTSLKILRIPASGSYTKDTDVNNFISALNPDWISLQFVPFSFQSKGMPFKLGPFLKRAGRNAKWHLMVHELWVGLDKGASVKLKIWRGFQKVAFKRLVKKLHPSIIHTHIKLYSRNIEALGYPTQFLPLFSNIPAIRLELPEQVFLKNKSDLLGIYFGSAPKPSLHRLFLEKIDAFGKAGLCHAKIIFCGKSGVNGKLLLNELTCIANENIVIESLGELSSEELGNLFLKADFGIARNSPRFIGKSGSSLAMLEHGLPIWIPFADEEDEVIEHEFREQMCFNSLEDLYRFAKKLPVINRLPIIADKFLEELNSIN